jgi:hypothetical protein
MTPKQIRIELLKADVTMAEIARKIPVSPQAVAQVVDRKLVSNRIMEAVSTAISKDKHYVFNDYFFKKAS